MYKIKIMKPIQQINLHIRALLRETTHKNIKIKLHWHLEGIDRAVNEILKGGDAN